VHDVSARAVCALSSAAFVSSPRVQEHLSRVYGTLALTLIASCVGVIADIAYSLGGMLSTIGCVMLMAILAMDSEKTNWQKRVSILGLYGFLQGCSVGPLVNLALHIDPAIVMTAFLGTSTIFVCFSLSAIYSQRRSYLYLGGMLASAIMFMSILSLVSIFYRPMWMYSIQLYFGLAVFCTYSMILS
jgi:FtsH-binding integral membrane protein